MAPFVGPPRGTNSPDACLEVLTDAWRDSFRCGALLMEKTMRGSVGKDLEKAWLWFYLD